MGILFYMKKIHIVMILLIFLTFFLRLYSIDLTILENDMFRDLDVGKSILNGALMGLENNRVLARLCII